jgi:hypothetical protein
VLQVKGCLLLWPDSGNAGFQLSWRCLVACRIDCLTRLQEIQQNHTPPIPKTVHITFPADGCVLNFFFLGKSGCRHSMECLWAYERWTTWATLSRQRCCYCSCKKVACLCWRRLLGARHTGSCSSLAKVHNEWSWLFGKITVSSWNLALFNCVIMLSVCVVVFNKNRH